MDDLMVFQAESVIFYTFCIIIPIITLLYTIGHLVFVIGEFKENNNIIPNIILFLIPKIGVLGLAISSILHVVFDRRLDIYSDIGFIIISTIWSIFILIESYMINKTLRKLDKFNSKYSIDVNNKKPLREYIYDILSKLISKNKTILFLKYSLIFVYGVLTIINFVFLHIYLSGHSLFIIFLMYLYVNYLMLKYYKKLKTLINGK